MIEQTAHDYNNLWLSKFSNTEYLVTSSDIETLDAIANLCIHKGGKSVAYARALLGAIYNHPFTYDDDCMTGEGNQRLNKENNKQDAKNNIVNVYPNPNTGSFMISYQVKDKSDAEIIVEDISGRLIYHTKLDTQTNSMNLALNSVVNGIYFVKLMKGKETISVNKVVINH
jgi:hypothetical protein